MIDDLHDRIRQSLQVIRTEAANLQHRPSPESFAAIDRAVVRLDEALSEVGALMGREYMVTRENRRLVAERDAWRELAEAGTKLLTDNLDGAVDRMRRIADELNATVDRAEQVANAAALRALPADPDPRAWSTTPPSTEEVRNTPIDAQWAWRRGSGAASFARLRVDLDRGIVWWGDSGSLRDVLAHESGQLCPATAIRWRLYDANLDPLPRSRRLNIPHTCTDGRNGGGNSLGDGECLACGERDCPHAEPLHYHHDGCPSCTEAIPEEKAPEVDDA